MKSKIEVIEIIPPALNTDLGGIGLHDGHPSVSDFSESVFEQLKEGKEEITFGLSEVMAKANLQELKGIFAKLNQ